MHSLRTWATRLTLVVVAVFALSSCSDSTAPSIGGTYTLKSIDEYTTPILTAQSGIFQTYLTGSMALHSNGVFTDKLVETQSPGNTVLRTYISDGTWEKGQGKEVVLTYSGGGVSVVTVSGGTLTQNVGGEIWVYQK